MNAQDQVVISELVYKSFDNNITPQEGELLNHYVKSDPEAAAYYVKTVQLHWGLRKAIRLHRRPTPTLTYQFFNTLSLEELAAYEKIAPSIQQPEIEGHDPSTDVLPMVQSQRIKSVRKISKSTIFSLVVSAAAVLSIILFVRFAPVKKDVLVGKCTNIINVSGGGVSGAIFPGCALYAGPMELTTGFAEIELDSGANVIVEAPAEFTLESSSQIYLQRGRLVVKVQKNQANPFVVHSSNASVVDYGTEFGVQVDSASNTLTHVYQGKVELRSGSNPLRFEDRMALTQDQEGLVDAEGRLIPRQGNADRFVRQDEFKVKNLAAKGSAYHRWLAYSYQLRRDPDLAAYYTFERDENNPTQLVNMANATAGTLNGILGSVNKTTLPSWMPGRWPEKTALSFNRTQLQFVEVPRDPAISINGPITIAVWVDCSGANDGGHIVSNRVGIRSLCNYQFGYRSPSMPEWKQGMHLARKTNSRDHNNQVCSKPLSQVSGWVLIAATHDNETLKFYLNGSLVETKNWPQKLDLAEGGLMIGTDYSPDDPSRFNGKIGEIVIARRVFTEEEIAEMYEAGKP